jgi:hypothetical protein
LKEEKDQEEKEEEEERWGRRMARREQPGGHLILVGKQLPPTVFDLSLFDTVRPVA